MESDPGNMFRGLPLTPEQDSEIRHYIHTRQRAGLPWDTPELRAMLDDMLTPPEFDDEELAAPTASIDAECRAAARAEEIGADTHD